MGCIGFPRFFFSGLVNSFVIIKKKKKRPAGFVNVPLMHLNSKHAKVAKFASSD